MMVMQILFVDDEQLILDGLKRSMRKFRKEWDVEFAPGGAAAIERMEDVRFDAVISDLRMPEMDGAEFLAAAKRMQPDTIRVVLSGHADRDLAVSSARSAHQFLAKPCTVEDITGVLRAAFDLRAAFNQPALRVFAEGAEIPKLPRLYDALCATIAAENTDIEDAIAVIEQDPSIAARVLQLVNSAFFGITSKIDGVHQAVQMLGLDTLKSIVLSSELLAAAPELVQTDLEELGQQGLRASRMCQQLGKSRDFPASVVDQAMTAAVLQNIGRMILVSADPPYQQQMQFKSCVAQLHDEKARIGFTHRELGAYTLALWGLSDPIVQAVCSCHDVEKASTLNEAPVALLFAANRALGVEAADAQADANMSAELKELLDSATQHARAMD